MQAFQLTEEYNTILFFSWYLKGFELLRIHLMKNNLGVDLEKLDFEAVDKEIEANEAAEPVITAAKGNTSEAEDEAPQPTV